MSFASLFQWATRRLNIATSSARSTSTFAFRLSSVSKAVIPAMPSALQFDHRPRHE